MFHELVLGDGRILEYADLGAPSGPPVLFLHGTPATGGQAAVVAEAARRHGVRLVAATRPGYGASSSSTPGLASTAVDLLELADHLGLDRFSVMGASGGGPFALAAAVVAPARVRTVAVHAGPGSCSEVQPDILQDTDRRALDLLAQGDPDEAMRIMVELGDADLAPMRGLSPAEFTAAVQKMAPEGENWFDQRPQLRESFEADFQRSITTSEGYARDNLAWLGPWDIDLASVTSHVRLVYGASDGMMPLDHAEWLSARLADSELHVVPGGHGHAVFGAAGDTFAVVAAG